MVGCWGTIVVFLMANQRSTRVQRICKKLQTVRGAGGQLLGLFSWLLEIFFRGEIPGRQKVLFSGQQEGKEGSFREENLWSFWFGCFGGKKAGGERVSFWRGGEIFLRGLLRLKKKKRKTRGESFPLLEGEIFFEGERGKARERERNRGVSVTERF